MHWRRKWQPTPVFLPGESQGRGSLVGCSQTRLERLNSSSRDREGGHVKRSQSRVMPLKPRKAKEGSDAQSQERSMEQTPLRASRRNQPLTPCVSAGPQNWDRGHLLGLTPSVVICWCYCSVTQSRLTLCDPMDCSTPGFPVLHHLLELAQTRPLSW